MSINYKTLSEIVVKNQVELDAIPLDFKGIIYIAFGTFWNRAIVRHKFQNRVVARGNSSVMAMHDSSVVARDNSSVVAMHDSSVVARDNSSVVARGNSSIAACGISSVVACGNSSVEARGNSSIAACDNSSVVACGNSSVEARDDSSVVARGNSSVVARGNSSVEARGNSSVMAMHDSSVVAMDNSSVVAMDNSYVEACGNSQIVNQLDGRGCIKISGNARIVYMPGTIMEYCDFYGLEHDDKTGRFFKCVHKVNGRYFSDKDRFFEYIIGEKVRPDSFDDNPLKDCGHGIHVAHLDWVLEYGMCWSNIAIIEVEAELKDIVVPKSGFGKVRCREVTVIREVPLEECGLFGKILAKRRTIN